jgi:hypothetical protein
MIVIRKGSRPAPRDVTSGGPDKFTCVNCSVESATHLSPEPRAARPTIHTQVNVFVYDQLPD